MDQLRVVISVVEAVINLKTARKEILLPQLNKQAICRTSKGGKGISTEINITTLTGETTRICHGIITTTCSSSKDLRHRSSRDLNPNNKGLSRSSSSRGGIPMTCFRNTLKRTKRG